MKNYNGLVQLEVNRLSGIAEAEYDYNFSSCHWHYVLGSENAGTDT